MTSRPAYSPCEPALGCRETAAKTSYFSKPFLELREEFLISPRLMDGRERVKGGNIFPGDRKHFRGGVKLHRARAEWNHGGRQRKITQFKAFDISQEFGLGVKSVENGMEKEFRFPPQASPNNFRSAPDEAPLGEDQKPPAATPDPPLSRPE